MKAFVINKPGNTEFIDIPVREPGIDKQEIQF